MFSKISKIEYTTTVCVEIVSILRTKLLRRQFSNSNNRSDNINV